MEAQAAAEKFAAQQQQAAIRATANIGAPHDEPGSVTVEPASPPHPTSIDEPTDLTLATEEKTAVRIRERLERERYLAEVRASSAGSSGSSENERDREPRFDFRHLMASQVPVKGEF